MLNFRDLTKEQIKKICNGCGGKGGVIKPPSFIFKASCVIHDFYYWRGCTKADRKTADKNFYHYMIVDIKEVAWNQKPYYHVWAFTYYWAVRLFGKKYFNHSNKMRTLDDL